MMGEILAATDGSALKNPGPAGWAWYIDDDNWASGGWPKATNNQAELTAVLELFRATEEFSELHLRVLCDSQYVINSVTKWIPNWKKRGWKKSDGKPVLNVELMQELESALAGRDYAFEWVKGHSGHPMNEIVDLRARAAAQAFAAREEVETGPGFDGQLALAALGLQRFPEGAGTADEQVATVEELEATLTNPATHASASRLTELLAESFTWVTPAGRTLDRSAVIDHRERAFPVTAEPHLIKTQFLSAGSVLLISAVDTARGKVIRSSIWRLAAGGSWRLCYRQETAAP